MNLINSGERKTIFPSSQLKLYKSLTDDTLTTPVTSGNAPAPLGTENGSASDMEKTSENCSCDYEDTAELPDMKDFINDSFVVEQDITYVHTDKMNDRGKSQ